MENDNQFAVDPSLMSRQLRHRLRNIASGIRGALSLIEEEAGADLPEDLREYFPLMFRECDALQEVAQRLSFLFDEELPEVELRSAEVITMRVVNTATQRFTGVDLRVRGSVDDLVDGWMETALTELVVNACEAAPQGWVEVRCRQNEASLVTWTVANSGETPAPETCAEMCKPFFTTRPRHLGVGLPVAQRLSARAGGHCVPMDVPGSDAGWVMELTCAVREEDWTAVEEKWDGHSDR